MLLAERAESERLRQIIKELQRHRFGRRAESLPEEQLQLGLEEAEQVEATEEAATEEKAPAERRLRAVRRRANRGALPTHLPRIETVVDIDSTICPGCGGALHRIGEDVAERLDIVPAQFRVLVVRRPKYACRACEDGVVQTAAPARLIEGGLPTEATVAQSLPRRKPGCWCRSTPITFRCIARRRFTPGKGSSWIARPWPIGSAEPPSCCGRSTSGCSTGCEHRPSCSPTRRPPRCSIPVGAGPKPASSSPMRATTDRGAVPTRRSSPMFTRPIATRRGRSRISPASAASCRFDGYAGYKALAERGEVQLAFCRSHVRRHFYELAQGGMAPIASEALTRIAALYRIEDDIRGRSADERRAIRQQRSRPLVDALQPWLREKLSLISQKTKLAEAIRYALSR